MPDYFDRIESLLQRVRARWNRLRLYKASVRAALSASAVIGVALIAARLVGRSPVGLSIVALTAIVAAIVVLAWAILPLGRVPDDRRVARFVEERAPSLEDRLVSAVHVLRTERHGSHTLAEPMLADTARRADALDIDTIVPADLLRRAGFQAAGALILLGAFIVTARTPAREAFDAAALAFFPGRVTLDVTPGNARVKAGTPFAVDAKLVGNRAPVIARVEIAAGQRSHAAEMSSQGSAFHLALGPVSTSFTYHVVAGTLKSPEYTVTVAQAPRVSRVDVDYTYPPELGLKPRTEEDSGDIYAPAGTNVRLRVHTDRPAAVGRMALGDGRSIALAADSPTTMSTSFTLVDDNSYRVALADAEGMSNPGDTEYFIRMLEDRPPDVRILKPAADRAVTRLEEIDIEAQADDDYGIERMDLVYAVPGSPEKVVHLPIAPRATSATGRHTLALEDLNVQPGDFVSYYVRARDVTRGKRSNETKSDIFFLEVRPYEQEFALAQSSAMSGGGGSMDDLVTAQKEIVVATWKLDRRAESAKGAKSEQDIRSVSRGQAELKSRVEQTSSSFRESTMRDPRRRPPSGAPRAGQTLPEEDAMTSAAAAMGRAVTSLDALKTGDALPPEMEALNHLLKAQADVKKHQVSRQQAGNGNGNNNRNYDMSTLFDKELQKQTQTNYENRTSADTSREESTQSALDKIKELARRQDELVKKQQELAKQRESLTDETLKRELEKLTREQSELRQLAEELSRQMNGSPNRSQSSGQQSAGKQGGEQSQSSSGSKAGADSQNGKQMRDISEEMRNAASDLRRQDPSQATARGNRALDKLHDLERQMQSRTPEQRRRALGEMQLEARQLADAQREVAAGLSNAGQGDAARDTTRRLAGEQERLAERTRKLQDGLKQQSRGDLTPADANGAKRPQAGKREGATGEAGADAVQGAAADANREIEQQQLADRMQKSADAMRAAGADARRQADAQQEMARSLDKLADKLGAATGAKDGESKKLSDQLSRAQDLKQKMASLSEQIERAGKQDGRGGSQPSAQKTPGATGRGGEGQQAGGGTGTELSRLKQDYDRQLQQMRGLMDELKRDDPNFSRGGGSGVTYEGQGMTLSAPGTEGFKQDFAKWEQLREQATQALDAAETMLSKKLQTKEAHDRLAAGVDDRPPPEYQKQVESYFKALAAKKKGG
jgi:hypothetical protein